MTSVWKPRKKHYIDDRGKKREIGGWGHICHGAVREWAKNKERDVLAGVEKKIGAAGHVYIVGLGFENLYKVGCTVHIERRLKELQAANPNARCVWSAWVRDMKDVERQVHAVLKESRVDREIFKLSQESIFNINSFVNNIKEKYT